MTQYLYDAEGRRVAKGLINSWSCDTTSNGFSATTVYVLGSTGNQLTELTNNSATWQWAHTNVSATELGIGTLGPLACEKEQEAHSEQIVYAWLNRNQERRLK
jgi:hypothetical protein